jgi:multicomponent Na+:H+ antiporter subunit B
MIRVLLIFWLLSAVLSIRERRIVRIIIYLAIFSLISSLCFLLFAAPDIALAEAVVSVFSTIIFIISFEKYYSFGDRAAAGKKKAGFKRFIFPILFPVFLFALFVRFIPGGAGNSLIKDQYISSFSLEVGGENAVTAIYLGYRLYDTLFEALMLMVSVAAIIHLSWHKGVFAVNSIYNSMRNSQIAVSTIRIICPALILFSVYLIANGHISPGGGFQGGVIAASFFICRYMIYDIFDTPVNGIIALEKMIFAGIILLALLFISLPGLVRLPEHKVVYLIMMNLLIGMKVSCGFFIMFYRFIAFERR